MMNGGTNPKDPLRQTPDQARQLCEQFSKLADGFPSDYAIDAAINIVVNALRQTHPLRSQAERRFDEIFGSTKQLLLSHYDSVTGKRRSVFPFTQVIEMPFHVDKDKKL